MPTLQGDYAIGMVFLPRDPELYETAKAAIHKVAVNMGNAILGWRKVPTNNRCGLRRGAGAGVAWEREGAEEERSLLGGVVAGGEPVGM